MEVTNKKANNNAEKLQQRVNKNNKRIFMILIIVFILLVFAIVIGAYKILNKDKTKVTTTSSVNTIQENIDESLTVELEQQKNEEPIVEQPEEVEQPKAEQKSNNHETSSTQVKNKYYIKVNYKCNVATICTYDEFGKYTVPVKAIICSTGSATPKSGTYGTLNKYRWKILKGNVWGQYSTRIYSGILFHSVPYRSQNKASLISKYYDKLGTTASAGCIRLTTADAKWIYDNCPLGTLVEFYSSSNPGPLGKPSAMKISSYPAYLKCWDPTDPDANNPWKTYSTNTSKPDTSTNINTSQETKNETVNNTVEETNTTNETTNNSTVSNNTENSVANNNQNTNENAVTNNVTNNLTENQTVVNTTNNTTKD